MLAVRILMQEAVMYSLIKQELEEYNCPNSFELSEIFSDPMSWKLAPQSPVKVNQG